MGVVPDQWYEKMKDKQNVNPFSAIPSIQNEYMLSNDKTTTETKLLRKTMVDAETEFFSLENEEEFEFFELKA